MRQWFSKKIDDFFEKVDTQFIAQGIMLWLGFLTLAVSMHADIFEQKDSSIVLFPWHAVKRLINLKDGPINLNSEIKKIENFDNQDDVYLFILDISKSSRHPIGPTEASVYFNSLNPDIVDILNGLKIYGPGHINTSFDIARIELIKYVSNIPNSSKVALVSFGSTMNFIYPENRDQQKPPYQSLELKSTGLTKEKFYGKILSMNNEDELSNFELLLKNLNLDLKKIPSKKMVHFVIASDFIHDLELNQKNGQSDYRAHRWSIKEEINELNKRKVFFHLSRFIGEKNKNDTVAPDVISLFQDCLDWSSYKIIDYKKGDFKHNFDFINTQVLMNKQMTFDYFPGKTRISDAKIIIEDSSDEPLTLKISLQTINHKKTSPFHLKIINKDKKPSKPKTINLDNNTFVCQVDTPKNNVIITPKYVLSDFEADDYLLLISINQPKKLNEPLLVGKTLAYPISFHKELSYSGAISILFCCTVLLITPLLGPLKRRRDRRKSDHAEQNAFKKENQPISGPTGQPIPKHDEAPVGEVPETFEFVDVDKESKKRST